MKRYDTHVHLAGIGEGSSCYVSPRMKRTLVYRFLRWQQKVYTNYPADRQYVDRLVQWMNTTYLDGAILLALDAVFDKSGKIDLSRSHQYIPNEYLFEVCRTNKKLFPGISVHPYRIDAAEQLQHYIDQGAVALKWLANVQLFDPNDQCCIPLYRILAKNNMPLIAHTGCEHTFPQADQSLGNIILYKKALDCGVIVIAAHCGVACPFHRRYDCSKKLFELFKSYQNLYADNSALTTLTKYYHLQKIDFLNYSDRIIHASDYPLPVFYSGYIRDLGIKKFIQVVKIKNPLERDIFIKKELGLPDEIFTNADQIFSQRILEWLNYQKD